MQQMLSLLKIFLLPQNFKEDDTAILSPPLDELHVTTEPSLFNIKMQQKHNLLKIFL